VPDQLAYAELHTNLTSRPSSMHPCQRLEKFVNMLNLIRAFCTRRSGDDWKRCFACGVCWLETGIAVHTHQLSIFMGRPRRTLNHAFHNMGYVAQPSRLEPSESLCAAIPALTNSRNELSNWSLRLLRPPTPQPNPRAAAWTPRPLWVPLRGLPASDAAPAYFTEEFLLPPALFASGVDAGRATASTPVGGAADAPFGLFGDKACAPPARSAVFNSSGARKKRREGTLSAGRRRVWPCLRYVPRLLAPHPPRQRLAVGTFSMARTSASDESARARTGRPRRRPGSARLPRLGAACP
jgi:hypothetical protein